MAARPATPAPAAAPYARLTGFLFLWLIVTGLLGSNLIAWIRGSGTFAEMGARIASSETLYRFALLVELLETTGGLLLGVLLYMLLKQSGRTWALAGLCFRAAEAIIGTVGVVFGFVRLALYTSPGNGDLDIAHAEPLVIMTRYLGFAVHNFSALLFSIGSLIFFRLFLRSGGLPRWIALTGVLASVTTLSTSVGTLAFPGAAGILQWGWLTMAVAEVSAGIWLMVYGFPPAQPRGEPGAAAG